MAKLEWGYASGDADPSDGVTRRFTMDEPQRRPRPLRSRPRLEDSARRLHRAGPADREPPYPGLVLLPSRGGVFGATYLNRA
ncbi:MAG: hypothetical protein R3B70_10670 [Polyangiaceae bacterium]